MPQADRETIVAGFGRMAQLIRASADHWHANDYFGRQDYQNHVVAHTVGMLALGYAIGDRELVQYALDHPDNHRDYVELIAGSILMPGDIPHVCEPAGRTVHVGEIDDRYRHFTTPDHSKGLHYSHLTLSLLTVGSEILYCNGLDFYRYVAQGGETLELPFTFYSDFYRTRDSAIGDGFYAGESWRIGLASDSPELFEIAALRYP
ncbi:MAG: alginate lyase family protein [Planctomycetota bacterium]